MTKWKQLETKITEKELSHILNFMKKNKIKGNSKFLRLAIEDFIGISIADLSRNKSPLLIPYLEVYKFYTELKKEFKNHPESEKILEEFFNVWRQNYLILSNADFNKQLDKANQMWPAFKEHEKIGRRKSPKRPRGKPADTGYDD